METPDQHGLAPKAGVAVRMKRSYLDSLNAGRQRRPDASLDDLNRALDGLESKFESLAGRAGLRREPSRAPEISRAAPMQRYAEPEHRKPAAPVAQKSLHALARDIDRARHQEDVVGSVAQIAADLTQLREEFRNEMTVGLNRQFEALRTDIENLYESASHAPNDPAMVRELDRIGRSVAEIAASRNDGGMAMLHSELEEMKRAIASLAREETLQAADQRWNDLGRRFTSFETAYARNSDGAASGMEDLGARIEQIIGAVNRLPQSLALDKLEEKVRTLASALDHFSRQHDAPPAGAIDQIEQRLDEISRAIVASSVSVQAVQGNSEPFERLEARIGSLASQIEDMASRGDGDLSESLQILAARIEDVSQRAASPNKAIEALAGQISVLSGKMSDDGENSRAADDFSARFEDLSLMLQRQQQSAAQQNDNLVHALGQRIEEIALRIDTDSRREPSGSLGMQETIDARFNDLTERLDELGRGLASPATLHSLESRLDDIYGRIEQSRPEVQSIDPAMLDGLEAQVARLAAQLSGSATAGADPALEARIDTLEQALIANRDTILDAAKQAVEDAIGNMAGTTDAAAVAGLSDDLKMLDTLARRSDERNSKTFEAIHDTLLKIVDRLGAIESSASTHDSDAQVFGRGKQKAAADLPVLDAPGIDDAEFELPVARNAGGAKSRSPAEAAAAAAMAAVHGSAVAAPAPQKAEKPSMLGGLARALGKGRKPAATTAPDVHAAADIHVEMKGGADERLDPVLANTPLEPGSGAPDLSAIMKRVREERGGSQSNAEPESGKSDFIAAARRAAQAAAAEAETLKSRKAVAGKAKGGTLTDLIKARRKPILMAVGAILIALAGLQLGKGLIGGNQVAQATKAPVKTAAATPAKAAEQKADASAQPAKAPLASASAIDAPKQDVRIVDPAANEAKAAAEPKPELAKTAQPDQEIVASVPSAQESDIPSTAGPLPLIDAARAGDAKALFEIGSRYADGRNGAADLAEAAKWYEKSADTGFAPAQYRIGNMHEKGIGVARDPAKAKTWYQMAAEQGNASAMHNLGVLFAMGPDGTSDNDSAARWFIKAAEYGVKDSQFNLGILAAKGVGVPQSLEESYKWFALAAKTGDKDAAAKRDEVANALRPEQLTKARATTELWQPKVLDPAANSVETPVEWVDVPAKTASIDMKKAVKNIQFILNKNGYDAGSADGVMGAKTKTAIAAFQKANGMAPTGEVDETLVRKLLALK